MTRTINRRQRGAALVVSLVMLVLITLLVLAALSLGTANFRSVSNTQFREQAISAANVAIQQRVSSNFNIDALGETTSTIPVDLNQDGTDEFAVEVTPVCISAEVAESADPSSVSLPVSMSAPTTWNTVWDLAAEVDDQQTGTAVEVHAGVRVLMTQEDKIKACP